MGDRRRNVEESEVAAYWKAIFRAAVRCLDEPDLLIDAVENYVTYNMDHGYVEDQP